MEAKEPIRTPVQHLPAPLNTLPAHTPAAIFAPKLGTLLQTLRDIDEFRIFLRQFDTSTQQSFKPESLIARLLWDHGFSDEDFSAVSIQHGLDLEGSATLYLHSTLTAAVVVLPLASPTQFKLWLDSIPAPARETFDIEDTLVTVMAPNAAHPLACMIRQQRALCQVGSPNWGDPNLLEGLISHQGPILDDVSGLRQAWNALTPTPPISAVIRPRLLVRAAIKAWGRSLMRTYRLRDTRYRKSIARNIALLEKQVLAHTHFLNGIAIGFDAEKDQRNIQLIANLTSAGSQLFSNWPLERQQAGRIQRWLSTPALFKFYLNAEPQSAANLIQYLGLKLPHQAINGAFGLMTVGLNAALRKNSPERPRTIEGEISEHDWLHLLPTTVAVGLRGPTAADFVHTQVQRQLQAISPAFGNKHGRPAIIRQDNNRRLEIQVLDDMLLASTGILGGHAALRRIKNSKESIVSLSKGFLFASMDLGAINAVLASAIVNNSDRPELQWAEATRRQLLPILESLRTAQLLGAIEDQGHRVRLQLEVGP